MREQAKTELENLNVEKETIDKFLEKIPMATHNQRGRGFISIGVKDNGIDVSLDRIIKIIHESMSSEFFELLKRSDEAYVVERAHRNPVFVEDCVRKMAMRVAYEFKDLPYDSIVTIKQVNEESIHKHNALAERVATMGELRKEIDKI